MKILYITIGQMNLLKDKSVHLDLLNALNSAGHEMTVVATREKRLNKPTQLSIEDGIKILRLKIGNLTGCGVIEKGITMLTIEGKFKRALKKFFGDAEFDLLIYATPPVTFAKVIKFAKKKYRCRTYLMLKDIFPQNAVDIGLLTKEGLQSFIYSYFKAKEKTLYKLSDKIGCMSEANRVYLLQNESYLNPNNVEIFQNALLITPQKPLIKALDLMEDYNLPIDKTLFILGGNLGKPQGLNDLLKNIAELQNFNAAHFVIIGQGGEKQVVIDATKNLSNLTYIPFLQSSDYEKVLACCDVGLISLDYRFTIPNYPSRILSYLELSMPILAATDNCTDIRQLVETDANCGLWNESRDTKTFIDNVKWLCTDIENRKILGQNGRKFLEKNFNVEKIIYKLL